MDIYCKVTPYGLAPRHPSDSEAFQRLRMGSIVKCKVANPRNYEHHKKFFALLRLTYENLPLPLIQKWHIHSPDDMLRRFKRDLGYYTTRTTPEGVREIEYKSISFATMEQHQFERFYHQAINLVLHKYIKGLDKQTLIEEVEHFK